MSRGALAAAREMDLEEIKIAFFEYWAGVSLLGKLGFMRHEGGYWSYDAAELLALGLVYWLNGYMTAKGQADKEADWPNVFQAWEFVLEFDKKHEPLVPDQEGDENEN